MKKDYNSWILATILLLFGVAMRLVPHMPNFTPVGALALFGGLYLPKRAALLLPLAVMLASDIFIGFYAWQIMVSVYASFVITGIIGVLASKHKTVGTVALGAIAGSIVFFLITNGAVWAFGTLYLHTFAGLLQSYLMGLPFFKYTLMGDLFYTAFLVGGFVVLKKILPRSQTDSGALRKVQEEHKVVWLAKTKNRGF